jgi:hypothetical protein
MTAMMEETNEEPLQVAAAAEETEDIRERSVKVTFPKKQTMTDSIMEEKIRIAASSFGNVVDVGMKEKLAVVLFTKSSDAFNFSCNHNGVLGEDFKVKFMGQAFVSATSAVPLPVTTNTSIDHATTTATTTTMSPKELSITNSPTKAEKAAAAAKAAALLADQAAAISSAVIIKPTAAASSAVTVVDVEADDMDAVGGTFQGITGVKHRDSKILLMNVTAAAVAKSNAVDDVEGDFNECVVSNF